MLERFALLLVCHALADGPLQPGRLSAAKRSPRFAVRWAALALHGGIHGALVATVTGSARLGALEALAHVAIDRAKARGLVGTVTDQGLHVACKVLWLAA